MVRITVRIMVRVRVTSAVYVMGSAVHRAKRCVHMLTQYATFEATQSTSFAILFKSSVPTPGVPTTLIHADPIM